jgi:hypothetical protein
VRDGVRRALTAARFRRTGSADADWACNTVALLGR